MLRTGVCPARLSAVEMESGSRTSALSVRQAEERLRTAMAAGNFEIEPNGPGELVFRYGTLLTQTATQLPKRGRVVIEPAGDGSRIAYEVEVYGFAKYWMIFFAILTCWVIFPPLIVHRALTYHPKRLMENLLQCL